MTEGSRIRVVVVDDHAVVRSGIEYSLLSLDDIELVGSAGSGAEALSLCEQVRPDVVLMDMMMPGMDGVAATRAIRERYPHTKVIALTSFQEGSLVQDPGNDLTDREREVLALIVEGKSNVDIADELSVSLSTARFHVSTILSKLEASNRAEAAALAVKHGLIG
jgi:NarL family two-component system response regulator LiaR